MARATISTTFDPDGVCQSLTVTVDYDAIDAPEALAECVKSAAVLWHVTDES